MSLLTKIILSFFIIISFSNSKNITNKEMNTPIKEVWDFTFQNEDDSPENIISEKYSKIKIEINKIIALIPRTFKYTECRSDTDDNIYCPMALSKCAEEWDYKDGYSIENKNSICPPNTTQIEDKCIDETKTVCNNGGWHDYNTDLCKKENKSNTYHANFLDYFSSRNYEFDFCTDHFTKMRLVPSGNKLHIIVEAQKPSGITDGRCKYNDYSSAWLKGHGLSNWNVQGAFKKVDVISFPFDITDVSSFKYTFSSSGKGCNNTSGSGEGNSTNSSSIDETPTHGYGFDNTSMTYCPGDSAQRPNIKINFLEIDGKTKDKREIIDYINYTPECLTGFKRIEGEDTCYLDPFTYSFYEYICSDEINNQGIGYIISDSGGDCNPNSANDLIDTNGDDIGDSCNTSTPPTNNCKRKKFTCIADSNRPCAKVDNDWKCSAFACNNEQLCGYGTGEAISKFTVYTFYRNYLPSYQEIIDSIDNSELTAIYDNLSANSYVQSTTSDNGLPDSDINVYHYGTIDKKSAYLRIFPKKEEIGKKGFIYVFGY